MSRISAMREGCNWIRYKWLVNSHLKVDNWSRQMCKDRERSRCCHVSLWGQKGWNLCFVLGRQRIHRRSRLLCPRGCLIIHEVLGCHRTGCGQSRSDATLWFNLLLWTRRGARLVTMVVVVVVVVIVVVFVAAATAPCSDECRSTWWLQLLIVAFYSLHSTGTGSCGRSIGSVSNSSVIVENWMLPPSNVLKWHAAKDFFLVFKFN